MLPNNGIIHNYPGGYQAAKAHGMTKFSDVIPLDSTGRTISAHHPMPARWLLNELNSEERNNVRKHITSNLNGSRRLKSEFVKAVQATLENLKTAEDMKFGAAHGTHARGIRHDTADTLADQLDNLNMAPKQYSRVPSRHDDRPVEPMDRLHVSSSPFRASIGKAHRTGSYHNGYQSQTSTFPTVAHDDRHPDNYDRVRPTSYYQANPSPGLEGPRRHTRYESSRTSRKEDELLVLELQLKDIRDYVEDRIRDPQELDRHKSCIADATAHLARLRHARHIYAGEIDEARKTVQFLQSAAERSAEAHNSFKSHQSRQQPASYEESTLHYDRSWEGKSGSRPRHLGRPDRDTRSGGNHRKSNSWFKVRQPLTEQEIRHQASPRQESGNNFDRSWEDELGGHHRHTRRSGRNSMSDTYEYHSHTNNFGAGRNASVRVLGPFPRMPRMPRMPSFPEFPF